MKLPQEFKALFDRDLERMKAELDGYQEEDLLWLVEKGINNSAGNLILHLCGNLQHFIGATLNGTGYERNREFEFSGTLIKSKLEEEIKATRDALAAYFDRVSVDDMSDPYPLQPFGYPMTKSQFLVHLYGHLNYHLGQINYHRRLLTESGD